MFGKDSLNSRLPLSWLAWLDYVSTKEGGSTHWLIRNAEKVGALVGPKRTTLIRFDRVVDRLPKTRSGKILRATMAKIADGEEFKMPATIDDPAVLDEIRAALTLLDYPNAGKS